MKSSASGSQAPLSGGGGGGGGYHSGHAGSLAVGAYATDTSSSESSSSGGDSFGESALLTLSFEQIVPFENYIRGISRLALNLGFEDDYNYFAFSCGIGEVNFRSGSLPDLAVKDAWMADLGVTYRRYFTEPHTFLSPYVTAGLYSQGLHWRYQTAVNVGGDVISNDGVGGGGGFLGVGTTIERGELFSVFGEVRVGQTWFNGETSEGFSNNVLDNYGYFSVSAGFSFRF